ncbi:cellulose binding domain-containing protein [Halomonas sp. WWR20]
MGARVDYTVTSQWNGGFVFEVLVTNTGTQAIRDYQVGFDLPGDITQVWNGQVTAHEGEGYVIMDDDDANDIAPGETARFKVQVASDNAQLPTRFTVNEQPAIVENPEVALPGDGSGQDAFVDNVAVVGPDITAAELQTLINEAPEDATVQLAAGDFVFNDSLTITRSDVSLVGAGSDATTITFTNEALDRNPDHGIYVVGAGTAAAGRLRDNADEHDTTLTLESGHRLDVGDTVRIWQDNDAEYFAAIGNDSWKGSATSPLRTSMAKVEAVDGSAVTLDRGVHFDFEGGEARIQRVDTLENVTLQGFTVQYELGTPDNAVFSNTLPRLLDYHALEFDGTVDSRMSDIQVINGPSVAFEFARSLDAKADHLEAHGSFNKGSGGNGYAYELYESYGGEFIQLEDSGMRHSALFASWRSSVNNEVHVAFTDRDINFHGGRDHDNIVQVDRSIRDPATDRMSPTLWINQGGESFGAPTDPAANEVTFDYAIGSRRNDVVESSDDGAYLDGALGHDTLIGSNADDTLRGGMGNDILEGGRGTDTAILAQEYADYDISAMQDGSVFLDGSGDDDILIDIERAVFADGTRLNVDSRTVTQGPTPQTPTPEEILANDIEVFPDLESEDRRPDTADEAPEGDAQEDLSALVRLESVSRWSTGYVMAVEVTNTSDTSIDNPQIRFDLPVDVTQFYGASLLSQDGDTYTVAYEGNDTLAPDATMRFSFKAYAPESHLPEALKLNDTDLAVDPSQLYAGSGDEPVVDAQTSVTSNIVNTWSSGYTAEVLVENTSNLAITNPTVSFGLPGEIDTLWNGVMERDGDRYTVSDDNANVLQPGDVWRFSYRVYDTHQALPSDTTVIGEPGPPESEPTTVTSNMINVWASGYTTEVLVENTSGTAIADPTVSFELPVDIDTLWNGVVMRDGNRYTVTDDTPSVLQPGDTWRFTYRVYDTDQALPSETVVQGQAEPAKVDPSQTQLPVDTHGNPITGEAGDTLTGTAGDDTLNGLRGDDYISGAGGQDRLVGGRGADMLTGGVGTDTFAYLFTSDSTPLKRDTILDFNRLEGDKIDLSAIDADARLDGNQNFVWLGKSGFSGNGGEIRTSGTTLQADVNGDGVVDMAVDVLGVSALVSEDAII